MAVAAIASCTESKSSKEVENDTMTAADDAEAYVRKYMNGTGVFNHLVIQDRLLRLLDTRSALEGAPSLAVDRLAADYIESKLSPVVQFERKSSLPDPMVGYAGPPAIFSPGTVYVLIYYHDKKRRPGSTIIDTIPAVAIFGDPDAIGARHPLLLTTPAPGDQPCLGGYCETVDEAFQSIRGRLDLVIRKVGEVS